MRIGEIKYQISYIVDLDDKEMVYRAKDAIYEDLLTSVVDQQISTTEKPDLTEEDISSILLG